LLGRYPTSRYLVFFGCTGSLLWLTLFSEIPPFFPPWFSITVRRLHPPPSHCLFLVSIVPLSSDFLPANLLFFFSHLVINSPHNYLVPAQFLGLTDLILAAFCGAVLSFARRRSPFFFSFIRRCRSDVVRIGPPTALPSFSFLF